MEGTTNKTEKLKVGGGGDPSYGNLNTQRGDGKIGANDEPEITLEQCVICRKRINKKRKKTLKKSSVLESVNEVWDYVEAFRNGQHSNEDDIDLGRLFGTFNHYSKFVKVPCVCYLCADEVQELKDLVNFLKAKLKELRRIVIESKKHFDIKTAVQMPTLLRKTTTTLESTSKVVSSATSVNAQVVNKRKLVVGDELALSIKPLQSTSGAATTTTKKILDNMDIKAENEFEMMEWDTLGNVIGEDPLALDDRDTGSNFSTRGDSDDDQSWNGSDTEDSSTSSDLDNKRTNKRRSSSDAMDAGNSTVICGGEPKKEVDSSEASEMDEYDNSSEEDDDPTWKSKRKSTRNNTNPYANICRKKEELPKEFKCDAIDCPKSYTSRGELLRHKRTFHNPKFPCTCGKIFPDAHSRLEHFQSDSVHINEEADFTQKLAACDMCGVTVAVAKLEAHVRGHVGDYAVKCLNAPKCQYVLTTFLAQRSHMRQFRTCRRATGDKIWEYSCKTCDFKSKHLVNFRNHVNSYHERGSYNRTLKCPITNCTEMFCVWESVHLHLHDKHNMKERREITHQKCVDCSEKIEMEEMKQHLKSSHQATQITQCQQCPFKFGSKEAFVDHLYYAHRRDVEALVCDICNDGHKFGRHAALREHYYSAHQIGTKQYVCDECGKAFFSECILKTHITYHDGTYKYGNKGSFRCDICLESNEFRSEETLINHKITVHGEDPFCCKMCGETFTTRRTFLRHKKTHLGITEKEPKCEVEGCEMKFTNRSSLTRHIRIVHKGVRHSCEICGKTYKDEQGLKTHNEVHHMKLRPFVCEHCGESFGSQQILKHHKLIHTGERPFECTICGQRFRHKVVLKRHMDAHKQKGDSFKPNGPMKQIRKRVAN